MTAKIAVVLSGCGHLDGAEIQESVLTLYFLECHGAKVQCFAPNKPQMHVVNHLTGEPVAGSRNVLEESARIARGKIADLATASMTQFDALVIPGGFGVAKNLSSFATEGTKCQVNADMARLIREARQANKPIVAICIAPAMLAAALQDSHTAATLTIGHDQATAAALRALGAEHLACPVDAAVVDETHKIISTPAYMLGPGTKDVGAGIEQAITRLMAWL